MSDKMLSRTAVAALLSVAAGCGGNLTLPDSSGSGLELTRVAGDDQTGPVGARLPDPLIVRVLGAGQTPAAGRRVAFVPVQGTADGSLDPDTAVTNSQGEAFSIWVLGTDPGEHQVEARLVAEDTMPPPVVFSASAVAGAPDTLAAASTVNRVGRRNQELGDPLVVRVADRYGNPVPGAVVGWTVTAGEGEVSAAETATGADGTAQVTWTLGNRIGVQKVAASVPGANGSPVTFTATVLF